MSKTWKVVLTIIISAIFILICSTTVNAENLGDKTKVKVVWGSQGQFLFEGDGLSKSRDIFCVQHGTSINLPLTMSVTHHITIKPDDDGNYTAYNKNGKAMEGKGKAEKISKTNFTMAYILNSFQGENNEHDSGEKGSKHWSSNYHMTNLQIAVRGYFGTWKKAVGLNFENNAGDDDKNKVTTNITKKAEQAYEDYKVAANVSEKDIEDQTDKDNLSFEIVEHEGKQYMKIGAFKWKFDDIAKLSNVQVLDQDEKTISDVLYGVNKNDELVISSTAKDIITSGKGFYVLIGTDSGVSGIKGISATFKVKYTTYTAEIWTLKKGSNQNLITTDQSKDSASKEINVSYDYDFKLVINISGRVWEDLKDTSKENEGEFNNVYDDGETLVEGIKVYLKDKDGNIIQETTTDANGEYKFENVLIAELPNYYVEFEYNGYTYSSVTPFVGDDSTRNSKSGEVVSKRQELNSKFTEITNAGDITNRNTGYTRDANGNQTGTLTYTNDTENYKSILESMDIDTTLPANTTVTGYSLEEQYEKGDEGDYNSETNSIENVNLGIYEREQPNMAIADDIEKVEIDVNGYNHIYYYSQRSENIENSSAFNVGVKFASEYMDTYKRAVYPSDVSYSNDSTTDDANKLKVYVTYAITVHNLSTTLTMSPTEIVNYYDSNYEIASSWLGDDETKTVTWNSTSKYGQSYNGTDTGYTATYTTSLADTKIAAGGNSETIYIKFKINDETTLNLLNNDQTSEDKAAILKNVTEIYSYSTYYGANTLKEGCVENDIYAGVDQDSAPGNATPGTTETYEDDTDKAPIFKLYAYGVREIEGTVFEDGTPDEIQSGKERLGDGIYTSDTENVVNGVKVELLNVSDGNVATIYPNAYSQDTNVPEYPDAEDATTSSDMKNANVDPKQATITTGTNGYYIFKGIEPGDYLIKYTYANGTTEIYDISGNKVTDVTVQNYKSTILTSDVIKSAFADNTAHMDWYKEVESSRYSDAKDDYAQREVIDKEMEEIDGTTEKQLSNLTNTTLWAQSPQFDMGVEYDSVYTASTGDEYTYKISDVDFGIVKRPMQSVSVNKEVSYIKVTLANGQVLIDGDPRASTLDYVTYTDDNIYITIDEELLYGAQLEIQYELKLINASEIDYREEQYYNYGTVGDESTIVTITQATLADYIDSNMEIKEGQDDVWTAIATVADLANKGLQLTQEEVEQLLAQYSSVVTAESVAEGTTVKPGESSVTTITVQRLLADSDDLAYDNNGEIVKISKTGGSYLGTSSGETSTSADTSGSDATSTISSMEATPGNYASLLLADADAKPAEVDEAKAETVTVIPPTGENQSVTYIIVGITALIVLGAGTYIVRKIMKL